METHGAAPGWTTTTAAAIGDGPYPGHRPTGSWRLSADGALQSISADDVDLAGRTPVIAYGSNANPNKLLAHPALFADGDDVLALRAAIVGWAAVWCGSRRTRDGVVVATLVPVPERTEVHPVLALTEGQLRLVDAWEGHPVRYRRVRHSGRVLSETGRELADVEVYLGTGEVRPPLLVDGRPLRCADVPYAVVDTLVPRD